MKIIEERDNEYNAEYDMHLPLWLFVFGIILIVLSAVTIAAYVLSHQWAFIIAAVLLLALGFAAILCWRNQRILIIDDATFEYTTMLGNKYLYRFDDIRYIRQNADSITLFVASGKVHIEFCAVITRRLAARLDLAFGINDAEN